MAGFSPGVAPGIKNLAARTSPVYYWACRQVRGCSLPAATATIASTVMVSNLAQKA
jgi:hypothetical protein